MGRDLQMYIEEICKAGKTIEVRRYFSPRYMRPAGRSENIRPSSEAVIRNNLRQAERKLRRLMNANFEDRKDALVTLDFSPEHRPGTYEEMKRQTQNFLSRLRRRFRRLGLPLRYIWTGEIGPKGGVHVHMMLGDAGRIGPGVMMETWGLGAVHIDALWSGGQYGDIASYFLKYANRTEETVGKRGEHIGRKWNPSRNLKQPEIRKHVVNRSVFRKKARPKKGYHLEKDKDGVTVHEGVSEITGLAYMCYTMIRD